MSRFSADQYTLRQNGTRLLRTKVLLLLMPSGKQVQALTFANTVLDSLGATSPAVVLLSLRRSLDQTWGGRGCGVEGIITVCGTRCPTQELPLHYYHCS